MGSSTSSSTSVSSASSASRGEYGGAKELSSSADLTSQLDAGFAADALNVIPFGGEIQASLIALDYCPLKLRLQLKLLLRRESHGQNQADIEICVCAKIQFQPGHVVVVGYSNVLCVQCSIRLYL